MADKMEAGFNSLLGGCLAASPTLSIVAASKSSKSLSKRASPRSHVGHSVSAPETCLGTSFFGSEVSSGKALYAEKRFQRLQSVETFSMLKNFSNPFSLIKSFTDPASREIRELQPMVDEINKLEASIKKLSDDEMKARTEKLKQIVQEGNPSESEIRKRLDAVLPEAFALVREASVRVIGLRHYDVQLLGGMVLHMGKIAEMKTGEGKTLVATLPAYLNALSGKGVHVVTVNDYLAKRDAETMGQIFRFLGMSVGLIQQPFTFEQRRTAYSSDVIYVTNSELGFDFLRDNLALSKEEVTNLRPFYYCVIDEVDSILIDEARTPLIISGRAEIPTQKYLTGYQIAEQLVRDQHYEVKEKQKNIVMTSEGWEAARQMLGKGPGENLYDPEDLWATFILSGLKAKELYKRGVQYVVKNGEVIIVDEFTGRVMPGRRWSEGLHQAIEAKERVEVNSEAKTLASISYQSLFKLFTRLSGMTGTAKTEEEEFVTVYDLNVVPVPTNRPMIRKDNPDDVFVSQMAKFRAVYREAKEMYDQGRPVLIGTTSVNNSELLSKIFRENKLPHQVLNARPEVVEKEAEIVAQAGRWRKITISTNMAGRGTDILLGGNPDYLAKLKIREYFFEAIVKDENANGTTGASRWLPEAALFPCELSKQSMTFLKEACGKGKQRYAPTLGEGITVLEAEDLLAVASDRIATDDEVLISLRKAYNAIKAEYSVYTNEEKQKVIDAGGLHIIGTERHESRRIDNQLRGRSGRQGDPGSSRFFLALDDDLLRIFGGKQMEGMMKMFQLEEDVPITSKMLTSTLDNSQKKVEEYFRDIRSRLLRLDNVNTSQRMSFYEERKKLLFSDDEFMKEQIDEYLVGNVDEIIGYNQKERSPPSKDQILAELPAIAETVFTFICNDLLERPPMEELESYAKGPTEQFRSYLIEKVREAYALKEQQVDRIKPNLMRQLERYVILDRLDNNFRKQEEDMKFLKDSLSMGQYSGRNPYDMFGIEGRSMFQSMKDKVRRDIVYTMFRIKE